jgi:hypothetical protein
MNFIILDEGVQVETIVTSTSSNNCFLNDTDKFFIFIFFMYYTISSQLIIQFFRNSIPLLLKELDLF